MWDGERDGTCELSMCTPRLSVEVRRQISEVRDFHHAGPRAQTQIVGLCSKRLHLLSLMLTSPQGFQRALLTPTGGKEELVCSAGFLPRLCLTLHAAVVSWFLEAAHWPAPPFIQCKVETCFPGTRVSGQRCLGTHTCQRRSAHGGLFLSQALLLLLTRLTVSSEM